MLASAQRTAGAAASLGCCPGPRGRGARPSERAGGSQVDAAALISAASRKEASLSRGSEQCLVVHSVVASICSPRGPGTDSARGLGTVRPRGPAHSGETGRDTWGTGPTASPNQGPLPQRDRASLSPGPCGVPPGEGMRLSASWQAAEEAEE